MNPTHCTICFEDLDNSQFLVPLSTCSHLFHVECLRIYFSAMMKESKFVFLCPDVTCSHEIIDVDIRDVIKNEVQMEELLK